MKAGGMEMERGWRAETAPVGMGRLSFRREEFKGPSRPFAILRQGIALHRSLALAILASALGLRRQPQTKLSGEERGAIGPLAAAGLAARVTFEGKSEKKEGNWHEA